MARVGEPARAFRFTSARMPPAGLAQRRAMRFPRPPAEGEETMDASELKALQAPLKAAYRENPREGLVRLKAEGALAPERIACKVETGRALVEAGLHPKTGGDGSFACSGDMLLEALCACAGVTMTAVAKAIGVDLRGGRVRAEADFDARGTLGVDREAPVGLTDITLDFEIDADADAEQRATLLKLTERYCVILQTLRRSQDVAARIA